MVVGCDGGGGLGRRGGSWVGSGGLGWWWVVMVVGVWVGEGVLGWVVVGCDGGGL